MSFGKSLIELKVTELKNELDKRSLDKTGVKAVLMERLEEAVKSEGHDITTYLFNVDEKVPSPCKLVSSQLDDTDESLQVDEKTDDLIEDESDIQIIDEVQCKKEEEEVKESKEVIEQTPVKVEGPIAIDDDEVDYEEHEEQEIEKPQEDRQGPEPGLVIEDTINSKVVPSRNVELEADNENRTEENIINAEESDETENCNLWISNIPNTTKASDLKGLFLDFGKVTTAKIFTTRNNTSPACYGSVTMADPKSAADAQKKVNKTNWKGRIISVELVTAKQATRVPARKPIEPPAKSPPKDAKNEPSKERSQNTSKNDSRGTKRAEIKPPESRRAEIKPPEKSPPKGESRKPRRVSDSKPAKHDARRSPPRGNVSRSRGGKAAPTRSDERAKSFRQNDRYERRQELPHGYSQRAHNDRRYRETHGYEDSRARYGVYQEPRSKVFESEEVRRLLHEREVMYKKRELELEKERARAQIQLERERLEKERLAVEQYKLQVQLQAQQAAAAQNFAPFASTLDTKTTKKDINPTRPRREDSRFGGRRRTPPRRTPPRRRADTRRSRSPPAKRRDERDLKDKYTNKTNTARPAPSHSTGYPAERRRSPVANLHSNSGQEAYGMPTSYSTSSSSKRADTTTIYNEKLANLGTAFAGGIVQPASYSYQRPSTAGGPAAYNPRGQYYETGTPYQTAVHQYDGTEVANYEAQLPGSWSRPRSEWDYSAATTPAEYKSYSRQY